MSISLLHNYAIYLSSLLHNYAIYLLQGRLRAKFMREIRQQEEMERDAANRGAATLDPDVAATRIQKVGPVTTKTYTSLMYYRSARVSSTFSYIYIVQKNLLQLTSSYITTSTSQNLPKYSLKTFHFLKSTLTTLNLM